MAIMDVGAYIMANIINNTLLDFEKQLIRME